MKTYYCMGYTRGNPGIGGAAVVVEENGQVVKEIVKGYKFSTDPRMHLMAVVYALQDMAEGETASMVTCSEYVYDPIAYNRLADWAGRWGWKLFNDERPNADLWKIVYKLIQHRRVAMKLMAKKSGERFMECATWLAEGAIWGSSLDTDEYAEAKRGKYKTRHVVRSNGIAMIVYRPPFLDESE